MTPATSSDSDITAGATLSWNLWDNGLTRAKVQEAETSRDVAKLTLTKDQEDIDLSLRQAYYNMREAEKRLNSTGDAVKQAEEDYFIAREKYRAGEGLMLDIIDAQEALSTARLNYISAEYDYARYKATVENAMGIELTDQEKEAAAKMTATAAEKAERAVLQEPIAPENAKPDKETKGLAKKAADAAAGEAKAPASDAAAQVIQDLAEGEVTK